MQFEIQEAVAVSILPALGSVVEALRIPCSPECGREGRVDYNIRGIEMGASEDDYYYKSSTAQIDDVGILPGLDVDFDQCGY
jgi:hypothetical protein